MANNSFTKNYSDGTALTEAKLDTAYQSLKLDLSNTTQMTQGATAGQYLKCVTPGAAAVFASLPDVRGLNTARNIGIKCTAASGALVFTLTTGAGSTPSASDPCTISFSSNGATQALLESIDVTTTKTLTLNASATLGTLTTGSTFVYLYALHTSTTSSGVVLGVSRKGDLGSVEAVTTTALSSSADSYGVLYSTASITQVPMLLGWAQVARNSTGSWQTPSKVNLGIGIPKLASNVDNNSRDIVTGTSSTAKAGGVAISASSSSYSTTSASYVDITNLAVTITTTGRPVRIELCADGGTVPSSVGPQSNTSDTNATAYLRFMRGTTALGIYQVSVAASPTGGTLIARQICGGCFYIDTPAAGTYTYTLQARLITSDLLFVQYTKLIAYEL